MPRGPYDGAISQVSLPSGIYEIKDVVAREMAAGTIHLVGATTTALTDMATTNPITVVKTSGTVQYTAVSGDAVFYDNKEFVFDGTNWHEFGDMTGLGDFAYADQGTVTITPKGTNSSSSVSFADHTKDNVLGEATTFTNAASAVSFAAHTTATVLKSDVEATVPAISPTTKYLTASASGTAVGVATSGAAITGLGTPDTDTFVKSYPGATSKLATTSVTGVSGSTTASKATAGTAVDVAKVGSSTTVATGSLGAETTTHSTSTLMYNATVDNRTETLSFSFKPLATTSITPAASNGTITPYTFTDVTVPKAASAATTVATGSLSATGGGDTVMTGLGTATTASAVTGYSDTSSDTFAKTVSVTAQPSVTLTSSATTSTGAVKYVQEIGTSGTNDVTFVTTGHTADAITALGAAEAAAQTITVGTNDKVAAITALGAGTAAAQTFEGTTETYDVNPKTS